MGIATCLSPDKRDLYFASRRHGGYGGSDIYVSHMQDNGKWGDPENLGPEINTSGDEQCPFIHADNQTLYFTSNYWPGCGDDDLFIYPQRTCGCLWSKPVNLGYPINTIDREGTCLLLVMQRLRIIPVIVVKAKVGWIFTVLNCGRMFDHLKLSG